MSDGTFFGRVSITRPPSRISGRPKLESMCAFRFSGKAIAWLLAASRSCVHLPPGRWRIVFLKAKEVRRFEGWEARDEWHQSESFRYSSCMPNVARLCSPSRGHEHTEKNISVTAFTAVPNRLCFLLAFLGWCRFWCQLVFLFAALRCAKAQSGRLSHREEPSIAMRVLRAIACNCILLLA